MANSSISLFMLIFLSTIIFGKVFIKIVKIDFSQNGEKEWIGSNACSSLPINVSAPTPGRIYGFNSPDIYLVSLRSCVPRNVVKDFGKSFKRTYFPIYVGEKFSGFTANTVYVGSVLLIMKIYKPSYELYEMFRFWPLGNVHDEMKHKEEKTDDIGVVFLFERKNSFFQEQIKCSLESDLMSYLPHQEIATIKCFSNRPKKGFDLGLHIAKVRLYLRGSVVLGSDGEAIGIVNSLSKEKCLSKLGYAKHEVTCFLDIIPSNVIKRDFKYYYQENINFDVPEEVCHCRRKGKNTERFVHDKFERSGGGIVRNVEEKLSVSFGKLKELDITVSRYNFGFTVVIEAERGSQLVVTKKSFKNPPGPGERTGTVVDVDEYLNDDNLYIHTFHPCFINTSPPSFGISEYVLYYGEFTFITFVKVLVYGCSIGENYFTVDVSHPKELLELGKMYIFQVHPTHSDFFSIELIAEFSITILSKTKLYLNMYLDCRVVGKKVSTPSADSDLGYIIHEKFRPFRGGLFVLQRETDFGKRELLFEIIGGEANKAIDYYVTVDNTSEAKIFKENENVFTKKEYFAKINNDRLGDCKLLIDGGRISERSLLVNFQWGSKLRKGENYVIVNRDKLLEDREYGFEITCSYKKKDIIDDPEL